MALPVVTIDIDYDAEKGKPPVSILVLHSPRTTDKIRQFLGSYAGKGIERGFADLDLDGDEAPQRKAMKYMDQLVRVSTI